MQLVNTKKGIISHRKGGFALITTISLIVLLALVGIALLTLSSLSLRSESTTDGDTQAQQNAKLALMEALSQLQATSGPDTRITAPANAVAGSTQPQLGHLTGVWRSWEGRNHDSSTGKPLTPNYDSKLENGNATDASVEGRFLGWLVSSHNNHSAIAPPSLSATTRSVPLLMKGVNDVTEEVHVSPTSIDNGTYAWWAQGLNTKALARHDESDFATTSVDDALDYSSRAASFAIPYREQFGYSNTSDLTLAYTYDSYDLVDASPTDTISNFHDFTPFAQGLLTNVSTGGWKRDLSLLNERWDTVSDNLSAFNLDLNNELLRSKAYNVAGSNVTTFRTNATVSAALYPWVSDPVDCLSWQALHEFATTYEKVEMRDGFPILPYQAYNMGDGIIIDAIPADLNIQFYYYNNGGKPTLLFKPIFTYWNPYNVGIASSNTKLFHYGTNFPLNIDTKLYVSGTSEVRESSMTLGDVIKQKRTTVFRNTLSPGSSADKTWKPGATKVFTHTLNGRRGTNFISTQTWQVLQSGFEEYGGYYGITSLMSDTNPADELEVSWSLNDSDLSYGIQEFPDRSSQYRSASRKLDVIPSNEAEFVAFASDEISSGTGPRVPMRDISQSNLIPFFSFSQRLRHLSDSPILPGGLPSVKPRRNISGLNTPVNGIDNSAYEFVFTPISSMLDPNVNAPILQDNGDASNFIGPSRRPEEGLSNWIVYELPLSPMKSILELQHFDMALTSDHLPQIQFAFGNSRGHYQIASDSIDSADGGLDHSYVNNHLFLDDWFVSSIAPQYSTYGSSSLEKSIQEVYQDLISGKAPLPNVNYKASKLCDSEDDAEILNEVNRLLEPDAWRQIASRLVVDGMFNINSTSVEAWAALLKSQKDSPASYLANNVTTATSQLSVTPVEGIPVSRFTLSGDPEVESNGAEVLNTFMTFSEDHMDTLAQYIVDEIMERGPFLSLSEFFNRQLTSASNPHSLSGPIESALNSLANDSDSPYNEIKSLYNSDSEVITSPGVFTQAEKVNAVYGTPGWARQADLLRPLAPVLSARDDSFIIRAYGASADQKNKAWCEAVVTRTADYVDSSDNECTDAFNELTEINQTLGRRYKIISFRWLSEDEI